MHRLLAFIAATALVATACNQAQSVALLGDWAATLGAASTDNWANPIAEGLAPFSQYGQRAGGCGTACGSRNHRGMDLHCPSGLPNVDPVKTMADGIVVGSQTDDGFGPLVVVQHEGTGFSSLYSHMEEALVVVGQRVVQGQTLGLCSNREGHSPLDRFETSKPHSHVEILTGEANDYENYLDMRKAGQTLDPWPLVSAQ